MQKLNRLNFLNIFCRYNVQSYWKKLKKKNLKKKKGLKKKKRKRKQTNKKIKANQKLAFF